MGIWNGGEDAVGWCQPPISKRWGLSPSSTVDSSLLMGTLGGSNHGSSSCILATRAGDSAEFSIPGFLAMVVVGK